MATAEKFGITEAVVKPTISFQFPLDTAKKWNKNQLKYFKFLEKLQEFLDNIVEDETINLKKPQRPNQKKLSYQKKKRYPKEIPPHREETNANENVLSEWEESSSIQVEIADNCDSVKIKDEILPIENEKPKPENEATGVDENSIPTEEDHVTEQQYAYEKYLPEIEKNHSLTIEHKDYNFFQLVANRLDKVRSSVERLLSNQPIKPKDIIDILNKLGVSKPANVRGSHNKIEVVIDERKAVTTFITTHKRSFVHGNQNNLYKIFFDFGIDSAEKLWPE